MRFRATCGRLLGLKWAVDNRTVTNWVLPNLCTCWPAALLAVLVPALVVSSLDLCSACLLA